MKRIDIDSAIRLHNQWRRQFFNAFAGGDYVDMPLSEHRGCMLGIALAKAEGEYTTTPDWQMLKAVHDRFHALANEIVELSNNGLSSDADMLLPELSEASHQLVAGLDKLRLKRDT